MSIHDDPEKMRAYKREWVRKKKAAYLSRLGPCVRCGGTEKLQLDHIDASTKVTHKFWSWSEDKLKAELAKCQVLCHKCHVEKSREALDGSRRFPREVREEIRRLNREGVGQRELARRYKTGQATIWNILNRDTAY